MLYYLADDAQERIDNLNKFRVKEASWTDYLPEIPNVSSWFDTSVVKEIANKTADIPSQVNQGLIEHERKQKRNILIFGSIAAIGLFLYFRRK